MADKNPTGPNSSEEPDKKKGQNPASKLPDWLRTDDWLQITPPPPQQPLASHFDESRPLAEDQATEMIELEDDQELPESPPSTMLFSDPDDSIIMMDDLPISGPLSGILHSGSPSSMRMPLDPTGSSVLFGQLPSNPNMKTDTPRVAVPAAPTNVVETASGPAAGSDDSIDLSQIPEIEYPQRVGPPTSRTKFGPPQTTRSPIVPVLPEDVLGQELAPTGPASGWLASATNLPKVTPEKTPDPIIPHVSGTWAELGDIGKLIGGGSKLDAPLSLPEPSPDSWHPSSGNVNFPSMIAIDLPPDDASDIFADATRIGSLPTGAPPELLKPIVPAAPVAPPQVELPKPKPIVAPTPSAGSWSTLPSLPTHDFVGSWHPSSGNVRIPSVSDIDLPPEASMGAGTGVERAAIPIAPTPLTAYRGIPTPLEPASFPDLAAIPLDVEPTQPASGWLASTIQPAAPIPNSGLHPIALPDLKLRSSTEIDLAPRREDEVEATDIFSTARRPDGSALGGSALFSGAIAPDSDVLNFRPAAIPGDSNLFGEFPEVKPPLGTARSKTSIPLPLDATGDIDLSALLQESPSAAISFSMPTDSTGSNPSSIEILDTSGSLDEGIHARSKTDSTEELPDISSRIPAANNIPEPDFEIAHEDTLEEYLRKDLLSDDDGKPDFDVLHGGHQSDSNLLGDRTFVEASLQDGPHSSGVNLMDPDRVYDEHADSGPASSIFNKLELPPQSSGGRIDIDEIPLMGSSDEGTDAIFDGSGSAVMGGRSSGPAKPAAFEDNDLEESVFEVSLPKDHQDEDSGRIDWAQDPEKLTNRLGMQQHTMESTQRSAMPLDDRDDAPIPSTPRPKKPKTKSRAQFEVLALEEWEDEAPPPRKRNVLLAGLGLLAGTGLGAAGMFTFGTGDNKPDAKMVAELTSVKGQETKSRSAIDELQKKFATAEAKAEELTKTQIEDAKKLAIAETAKKTAETNLTTLKKSADDAILAAKTLEDEKRKLGLAVTKATVENETLTKLVTKAQTDLDARTAELSTAKSDAEAVASKLKATDALLDPIIEKLKSAKLIDEKANREAAIKDLPNAVKKANLITGDGDVAKLATQLSQIRDELTTAKKDADSRVKLSEDKLATSEKESAKLLADAKSASAKAMTELQTKLDTSDKRVKEEVTKAIADVKKEAEEQVATAKKSAEDRQKLALAEIEREKSARIVDAKQFEAKTAQLTEQFEKQVATARIGVAIPLSTTAAAKVSDAATSYDSGTTAYLAGRYSDAEQFFASATKSNESDARYWYFLGLTKYAQGRTDEAASDFKKGAEWEGRAKPGRRSVSSALEQVQGSARLALESARP